MSSEESKPKLERVDIATKGSKLEAFRAFRGWAEVVAKRLGQEMDPIWYKDGPEDRPRLYSQIPEVHAVTLRELVRMPGGEEWWKQKGTSVDTSDDLLVLHDYARKSAGKHKEARSILDNEKPESLDIAGDSDSDPEVDDDFWEWFNERQIARQNGDKKDGDCHDPSERYGLRGSKGTQED